MKPCLNCNNDFEAKKEFAKFCSTRCRVAYNRKHPNQKNKVSNFEIRVLYNEMLDMLARLNSQEKVISEPKPQEIKQHLIEISKPKDEIYTQETPKNLKDRNWFLQNAPDSYDSPEVMIAFRKEIESSNGLSFRERKELLLAFDSGNLFKF